MVPPCKAVVAYATQLTVAACTALERTISPWVPEFSFLLYTSRTSPTRESSPLLPSQHGNWHWIKFDPHSAHLGVRNRSLSTPEHGHYPGSKQEMHLGNKESNFCKGPLLSTKEQREPTLGFLGRVWWHRILRGVKIIDLIMLNHVCFLLENLISPPC